MGALGGLGRIGIENPLETDVGTRQTDRHLEGSISVGSLLSWYHPPLRDADFRERTSRLMRPIEHARNWQRTWVRGHHQVAASSPRVPNRHN